MEFFYITALLILVAYSILLGYCYYGFTTLPTIQYKHTASTTSITVIVPARNEALNILNCLHSITAQVYPTQLLQVIIVNDYSTDATVPTVQAFAAKHPTLSISILNLQEHIPEHSTTSHKKQGIALAIAQATGSLIVCTDADCVAQPTWLASIAAYHQYTQAQCIACPVVLLPTYCLMPLKQPSKLSYLQAFQMIDFVTLQGITAAAVHKQLFTMCNGANLAYTKAAFTAVGGFTGIDAIASGDDMLLMHKIATAYPTQVAYYKCPQATVYSATTPTWQGLWQQRIRWASKSGYYNDQSITYTLFLVYFTNVAALAIILSVLIAPHNAVWALLYILIKSLVEYWFLVPVLRFYKQLYLGKWFWLSIPTHILYTIIIGWLGKYGRYEWKGRVHS